MSNLWRPFSVPALASPLHVRKGQGVNLADRQGREYLDAVSGLWNTSVGLNNPALVSQMHAQLQELSFSSLFHATNSPAERLSTRLVELSQGRMQHVYLSTTGSSAVEVALRVSRIYQRARGTPDKKRILGFDLGYHGCSGLGMGVSGILAGEVAKSEDFPPHVQTIPSPLREGVSLDALASALHAGDVASLIMEPVLGSGGVIVPSKEYCREVRRLCSAHGALLIADEVATGTGRCGAMFASDLLDLAPDVITLSKGLNGGYFPLAATLFAEHVVQPISAAQLALQYGCTQDGNPVGCVSALATLDFIAGNGLERRAAELGAHIRGELANSGCPVIREVRGLGMMIGIELAHVHGGEPFSAEESARVRLLCQEAGLLVYHFDAGLSLFPALTITDDEVAVMLDILNEVLATLC
ncbi:aminotransferase family protein [Massilia sp. DD77]|uniref:aminotransferase family protein n=1 Tax=Massilia sp. DD77 TaxID=3109349 RepID=UPI002FFFF1CE